MARNNNLGDFLKDVADAIREKTNASGLINPQDFPERIAAIETGGSGEQPEGTHTVQFIDVDGTILKTQYVADGGAATPPPNPTREKCEFVKWLNAYSNVTKDTEVFALYKSADGSTWYKVKAAANDRMNLCIKCDSASPVTIDWGDGSTDTATNRSAYIVFRHDYSAAFEGWVKVSSEGNYRPSTADEGNPCVKEVIVGDNVGTVGSVAREMTNLTAIVIPETVAAYEGRPFRHCVSLVSLALPDGATTISTDIHSAMLELRYVRLPNTFTAVSPNLLGSCYGLQSVTIPDGVTSIGANAFQNCYSLQSVTIPDGVTSIGAYAFQYCSIAVFTASLSDIPPTAQMFKDCRRLGGPLSLTTSDVIPYGAFSGTGITSLYSNTLRITRTAQEGAFANCFALTRVELPDVTDIASGTFYGCTALALAIIGADVTNIGATVFQNCTALARLVVKAATPPTLASNTLQGCSALAAIYVPDASVEAYKTATNWAAKADIIKPLSEFVE